ncbi:MAG: hypothetical protein CVV49_20515 [Spirochaetae bacterium HGW-Spirochaetae-5]|nr:MAG: hypothetical protein CVV49_20515 [Spirochaetae bacterium HGW-Spirochaetae-5]
MSFFIKAAALTMLIVSLTFSACGGGGDTGGGDTETPASTLFASKSPIAAGAICPAGGIRIDMGFDNNKNNVLDANEITKTEYVCNGEDGSDADVNPFVVHTNPIPTETDVELDTVISVVFNTAMDGTTITDSTFTVKDSAGAVVSGTINYSGIVAVFTPDQTLKINTKYTVNLLPSIKSASGKTMGYNHYTYFTGGKAAVIYKANGATGGTVPVDANRYNAGSTVNASANSGSLVKTGYSFSGWNTEEDCTGTPYAVGESINITTTSVILYAMWTTAYTVIYHANGGTGSLPTDSNLYIYGQDVTVKANIDLVNGELHFAGWNKKADGSGDNYAANAVFQMGNENVTLYAKWISGYTVTYNVGTGNTSGTVPVDGAYYSSGATVTVLGNTGDLAGALVGGVHASSGIKQRFIGWNTDSGATSALYTAGDTFNCTENITLYAIYTTGIDVLRKVGPAGGLIFYDKGSYSGSPSWRYLEAWKFDELNLWWWKADPTSTAGTLTAIGTGYVNTYTYMLGFEHGAAEVVRNATHGVYSGWFLPSKDELNLMYTNLKVPGVGDFGDSYYWSSSQSTDNSAWLQYFLNGNQGLGGKRDLRRVRAVRAF